MRILAFYEIDREYGGSEEGGWWYDTGRLVRPFRMVRDTEESYRLCRRANHLIRFFQDKNRRIRDVGSVAYRGGRFAAENYEDELPDFYPEVRPHYE